MKIQPYIQRLNSSTEYKKFKDKYTDAFLIAGFFVIDLEFGKNIHQVDFYIPSTKKIAAFTLDSGIALQILDTMTSKVPEKLDIKTNVDLDAIHGILEEEMKNRNITEDIKKIIAVIQTIDGKKIWNINSVLSGMDILKAHIEDESKTVLKMEKTSFMDIMKKMPNMDIQGLKQNQNPDEAKEELEKLDKLEHEIEQEKGRLKKQLVKKENPAQIPKSGKKKIKVEKEAN